MATKDGGPAFPMPQSGVGIGYNPGMSLRAWFAGQAIMSFRLKIPATVDEVNMVEAAEKTASYAFLIADALLAELAKGTP